MRSMFATLSPRRFPTKVYNKMLKIALFHHIYMYVLEKVCEEKEVEVAKHVCEEDEDSDTE